MLDPAQFLEAFALGGITFRCFGAAASFAFEHGQSITGGFGQPCLDGGDRRPQPGNVAVLGIASQPVLIIVAGDDRVGPPR